ncbi:MAG: HlyD family efflux transporter periplasmic adaptor subunit [Bacteroidaceae bacterium]|nr:HlyD family efflux transporter periplasmic adaptor subunit [Bacteroidaceae bacterium]
MKKHLMILPLAAALTACGEKDVQYDASGVFEVTEVTVSAQATGEITSLTLEEGDTVAPGVLLGTIDDTQLRLQRQALDSEKARVAAGQDQARAAQEQARAAQRQTEAQKRAADTRRLDLERQVAALRQQIANLQHEEARFRQLVAEGAAAQKQVDDITQQIAVAQRQLAATEEQIAQANSGVELGRAAYDAQGEGFGAQATGYEAQERGLGAQGEGIGTQQAQLDDRIAHTRIASPIGGTVLAKYMEQGEYATAGRPLFKVADVSRMTLRAYVTADQLTRLKIGQRVTVYADQGTDGRKAYAGTVAWISERAEFTPRTIQTRDERANLVYAVKISVANDGLIKRGMYGDVKF